MLKKASVSREQLLISLCVVALWSIGLFVGLFSTRQVFSVRKEVSFLLEEATELSRKLYAFESEKEGLVNASEEMLKRLLRTPHHLLGATEVTRTAERFSTLVANQGELIVDLESKVPLITAWLDQDTHQNPLSSIIELSQQDILRLKEAVSVLQSKELENGGGSAPEIVEALESIIAGSRRGLLRLSSEISALVATLMKAALNKVTEIENTVFKEVLLATLIGVLLGAIVVRQISILYKRIVESEQIAALGKLAVSLHHEINNPLSVIVGNSYLIRATNVSERERNLALQAMEESAKKIASVIQQTKDIEKLVTTEYVSGIEMIDLNLTSKKEAP